MDKDITKVEIEICRDYVFARVKGRELFAEREDSHYKELRAELEPHFEALQEQHRVLAERLGGVFTKLPQAVEDAA